MIKKIRDRIFQDDFEYHGNTVIEHIRRRAGVEIWRNWLIFDSVEEAVDYFNDNCLKEPQSA